MSLALYLTELRAQTTALVYCCSKANLNIFREQTDLTEQPVSVHKINV